jgi:hypothetical protein
MENKYPGVLTGGVLSPGHEYEINRVITNQLSMEKDAARYRALRQQVPEPEEFDKKADALLAQ